MRSTLIRGALIGVVATTMYAGTVLATPTSGVKTTILAKSQFDDIGINAHTTPANLWKAQIKTRGRSDLYVVDNKFTVGGTTGWHSHPGPSLIMVVAGTVTNYMGDDPSCTGHTYRAGDGFIDPGGDDVHMLRNDGSTEAETIAVQLLPTTADRRIEKPDPGNCHF
jgi:quercetin dioxygenase-like cupin family protein